MLVGRILGNDVNLRADDGGSGERTASVMSPGMVADTCLWYPRLGLLNRGSQLNTIVDNDLS
jgi:hypothetical protein